MKLISELEDLGLETGQWVPAAGLSEPFSEAHYAFRPDGHQLEILVVKAPTSPSDSRVKGLWAARQQRQHKGLLLLIEVEGDSNQLITCGPAELDLTVRRLPRHQMMTLLEGAIAEDTPQAAERFLAERLKVAGEEPVPGLLNSSLFADHTLTDRARRHPDWVSASETEALEGCEGTDLVEALGFSITDGPGGDTEGFRILREAGGQARALGIFLDKDEEFDQRSGRFTDRSPTVVAIERARQENLPFVLITRGSKIRLHPTGERIGVGRKDAVETFIEAHVPELSKEDRAFVPLLFSARALVDGGSFEEVLSWSRDYSADLSARLRERVYNEVVPGLAMAIAAQTSAGDLAETDLDLIYEQAMLVLFRLLFIAYAEDRDLLPYRLNDAYHENSLKSVAKELASRGAEGPTFEGDTATDLWARVGSLWEAVDKGNQGWGVPPYGGGLFDADASAAATGLVGMVLDNEVFGPPLTSLLVEQAEGEAGPVDFRSLAVRDFGTIYEGLLESSISVAPSDLKLDRKGNYVPATEDDEPEAVVVEAGTVYHHNRSGQRKATGSYFTKEFAVEHLLDKALEPALDAHLERVEALLDSEGDEAASKAFFDFRCADIAMGSGHFLVAASDRIEDRFTQFLLAHPLEGVQKELSLLRASATDSLGPAAEEYEIDDRMLLRRLVARRCLYGVDLNQIAVELARLAIWVHTFVPGLPLSFLDHTLVYGDSLTGIGTVEEAQKYLTEQEAGARGAPSFFSDQILEWLEEASAPLLRLANAVDSTREDLEQAKKDQAEALEKVEPVRDLFDLICAGRRGELDFLFQAGLSDEAVAEHPQLDPAREKGKLLNALHFPVAFPEVFIRQNPGFDCLIGNPPWEKLHVEEHGFWALRFPGLRGMPSAERNEQTASLREERPDLVRELERDVERAAFARETLSRGPYPGLGRGHPDLFKAFAWRFWSLVRQSGRIGLVLPRASLSSSGSAAWRQEILDSGRFENVVTLQNRAGWVFPQVHKSYTIALVVALKDVSMSPAVSFAGPYRNREEFEAGLIEDAAFVPMAEFRTWSDGLAFPLLPSPASRGVFRKVRKSPRFDSREEKCRFRPVQGDFNATSDRDKFIINPIDTEGLWPVYGGKGFDLWEPTTGKIEAWADPERTQQALVEKRRRQTKLSRSAFFGLPERVISDRETLPCQSPRIAFRDVTNRLNQRTVVACLVPAGTVLNHTAPFLFSANDRKELNEAFLLGVLCSLPLDWYSRRFVESHVTFEILSALPIPLAEGIPDREISQTAGRLAASDERFADWAEAVGVEWGPLDEEEKNQLIARLDALVATAYGLDRDDLIHIFETFHEGWDYQERLDRTLAEFEAL